MAKESTPETDTYLYAHRRIGELLQKLKSEGICAGCTGLALMLYAMELTEAVMGSAEAAEMAEEMAAEARKHDHPAPNYPSHH